MILVELWRRLLLRGPTHKVVKTMQHPVCVSLVLVNQEFQQHALLLKFGVGVGDLVLLLERSLIG